MPSIASIVNIGGGTITQISGNSYSSTSDGTSGSAVRPKFDFATTAGKRYKLTITPTGTISGTINFDFYDGSSYLFQNYDFTTTKEIYFIDNGSVFGAFDGTQTYNISSFTVSIKEATIDDLARVDYTDGTSSLLVEPQRTNNLTASQDLTDLFWNSINVETIVASTVLSPDGTTFGFKAIPSTSTSTHYVDYDYGFLSMPSGVEVTYSVFAKPFGYTNFQLASSSGMNARYQNFELTGDGVLGSGDVNGATIKKIGDWYRCTITEGTTSTKPRVLNIATPSSGLGRNPTFTGNGTDGVLLWGAQLEEGTYPTSYIPNLSTTSGSTVTRVQETYTKTGISDKINSEEGVLFVEGSILSDDGTTQIISLFESASSRVSLTFSSTLNRIQFYVAINGYTNTVTINAEGFTKTQVNKIALRYGANNYALFINGVKEGENTTQGNTFTVGSLTELTLSNTLPFYGKVKQLQVFKTALTDDELTILTGTSGVHFYTSYAAMASGLTYKIE